MNEREKLVELLNKSIRYAINNCKNKDPRAILDTPDVADYLLANGVTVQRWIPVTERLPDIDEKCLLCMENRITKYRWVTIGYFHTNYDEYVTHWIPLPEPPKGES